ncbi:MAG: chromosome partitioning protein [Oleiphilaceae bacterium]|jgi:chromosome partitioning protein
MLVITIANRKGGTGKTTTAVNLATQWGECGLKTLLIDLDTQGHAAIGLGCADIVDKNKTIHALFRNESVSLHDVVTSTSIDNVSIARADTDFIVQKMDDLRIRNAIYAEGIDKIYDRIVIDTPPTLDGLLYNGLAAANGVVVPFVPHHLAEVGVKQLAKLFYQVATRHNPNLSLFGLLPIMYDRKIKLHQRVLKALGKQFGSKRIMRGIRTNIKLAEAFEAEKPISHFAPNCPGAMDYRLMGSELETAFNLKRD